MLYFIIKNEKQIPEKCWESALVVLCCVKNKKGNILLGHTLRSEVYEAILLIVYMVRDIFDNFCIGYSRDNFLRFCPF